MRVVVLGSSGRLGRAMLRVFPDAIGVARSEVDMGGSLVSFAAALEADVVVNCAAYTAVDRAEEEEAFVGRVNGSAVGELAQACSDRGVKFVTFSSDYVFDGKKAAPYVESDPVRPLNAYGRSKALGEQLALDSPALVVRTAWLQSWDLPCFVSAILSRAAVGEVEVIDDAVGSPTVADDLAKATREAIAADASGLLHLVNGGTGSWHDLALASVVRAGLDPARVRRVGRERWPSAASRPPYSALASERVQELGLTPMRSWESAIGWLVDKMLDVTERDSRRR